MRVLCIDEGLTGNNFKPCQSLAHAALKGQMLITMSEQADALETLRHAYYDLAVIQQHDLNGKFVRHVRSSRLSVPIVIIANSITPAVAADTILSGADACLPELIDPDELLARLNAIVRRTYGHASQTFNIGRLTVNLDKRTVYLDETSVKLTRKEYALLELFVLRQSQILSRESILDSLYDQESEPYPKVVDVMLSKIRRRFRSFGIDQPFITMPGIGYCLNQAGFKHSSDITENSAQLQKESCVPIGQGITMLSAIAAYPFCTADAE
jgi:two-component system, cell cycle response regulator CtrA